MNLKASSQFFFCVKLQFVALHPWQSIAYTGLNVGLSRSEIARWCTVRDFCVISVLVIVTAVTCYDIRQGLWIQGDSTGPRTDPWVTPKTRGIGVDIKPSTTTDCVLSLRYDSNQDSANPEIPKVLSSRLNRMAWSRVSKAAFRSNSASIDTSFWSDFVGRPSSTLKTAVSVLWDFLYADCRISSKLFAHRWDCSWRTTLSSIFETNGRFETGLKFLKSLASRPCFFSMGVTRAWFNPDGTVPVDKEILIILVTRGGGGWGGGLGHADTA